MLFALLGADLVIGLGWLVLISAGLDFGGLCTVSGVTVSVV